MEELLVYALLLYEGFPLEEEYQTFLERTHFVTIILTIKSLDGC